MEKFKVGDWVICNIDPFKITNINNGIINSHCEIKNRTGSSFYAIRKLEETKRERKQ